jgi:SAM-dependent methyltransferase
MPNNEWFTTWFDSPYYPLLYAHRNEDEALAFSQRVVRLLRAYLANTNAPFRLLDLACGRGRYSAFFAYSGYDVTGVDLSANSIAEARAKYTEPSLLLQFLERDIRDLGFEASFDVVVNLFTSFGYFQTTEENQAVLHQVSKALETRGIFVIDFFNAHYVLKHMVAEEIIERGAIRFKIKREIVNHRLVKSITINDPDVPQPMTYLESVRFFYPEELENMLEKAGFEPLACFGDYTLISYMQDMSPRFILFAYKR